MGDPTTAPVPQQAPQVPVELLITQSVATTVGVLIALFVAALTYVKSRQDHEREDRKANEDRERYETQLATLQRAERDRIESQARRIVPTSFLAEIFGPKFWTVRVVNTSTGPITDLDVQVTALDSDGNVVANGASAANKTVSLEQAIQKLVGSTLSGAISGGLGANSMQSQPYGMNPYGAQQFIQQMQGQQIAQQIAQQAQPRISRQVRDALIGGMVSVWPQTLIPEQPAIMTFEATEGVSRLAIKITFTDEAGYRWQRTDVTMPEQVRDDDLPADDGSDEQQPVKRMGWKFW